MKIENRKPCRSKLGLAAALLAATALLSSCATKSVPVRPGAVSSLDSQAYDALLVAQEVIAQSKASLESGALPAAAKPVINAGIASYNTARAAWLTYRTTLQAAGGAEPERAAAELRQAITELIGAIAAIPKLKGAEVEP